MISSQIIGLLSDLKSSLKTANITDGSTIGINEIVKKAGVLYEKVRYAIDYREEHTIRRTAIERILNRNLFFGRDTDVAEIMLKELIRAGYIENNKVLESKSLDVQNIINKFLLLKGEVLTPKGYSSVLLRKKIISLAASEIEVLFFNDAVEEATVNAFYNTIKDKVKISGITTSEHEKDLAIYIATRRSLLKNDDQTLTYRLWLKFAPNWEKLTTKEEITTIARDFLAIEDHIAKHLNNTLTWYLVPKLKNYGIYFSVIEEIVKRYGAESERIFSDQELLNKQITEILGAKYKKENSKTRKSATRAVLYILLTKTIIGIAIEFPYDKIFLGHIYYNALIVNIIFHPILLFFMTSFIKPLDKENTKNAIAGISSIVYGGNTNNLYVKIKKDKGVIYSVFLFLYAIIFFFSFGFIYFTLAKFNFSIVSIGLFLFFLTLVSYFGLRIRYNAKAWKIETGEERILYLLWNFFTLPIIDTGRWLSTKFAAVNVFVWILDFIIETPFKLVLEITDAFVSFLKEKKEQIR